MQKMSVREYTRIVAEKTPFARVTWMTAGELLDILNRLNDFEQAQDNKAIPIDEPDYGDVYGKQVTP